MTITNEMNNFYSRSAAVCEDSKRKLWNGFIGNEEAQKPILKATVKEALDKLTAIRDEVEKYEGN